MKKKWYRSKGTKTVLVIAEHILTLIIVVSVLCGLAYPSITEELLTGRQTDRYEDSCVFDETMQRHSSKAVEGIWLKALMESDGQYNENKIIDIQEFWDARAVSGKNNSGLSYRLKDLLAWNVDNNSYGNKNDYIIVCERKDGTYYYYKYAEFARLISTGELRLNGFIEEADVLLEYLQNMGDTREDFLQIQNAKGDVQFVNCWTYDGTYFKEQFKPIGANSILEIVNEDERWNGRLQDAYDMIYSTVHNLCEYNSSYQELENGLKEGDTNYRFVYVDKSAKKSIAILQNIPI